MTRGKVKKLLTHDLMRLKRELEDTRLSAVHSTLGLSVLRAALHSFDSGAKGGAPAHVRVVEKESD
ncbi:hypothetical protein SAMN05660350_00021 [Geodermatophilus obscurus]|uniref:Uncharacterized protein n=1 Tax=Geodermatophilus obscurus TaxID=1861 RepID=A0A1M7RRE9_9ACTN|nr:hypothetical protein SAMN05660350_00021 [Geodermatophilus obscurus]